MYVIPHLPSVLMNRLIEEKCCMSTIVLMLYIMYTEVLCNMFRIQKMLSASCHRNVHGSFPGLRVNEVQKWYALKNKHENQN